MWQFWDTLRKGFWMLDPKSLSQTHGPALQQELAEVSGLPHAPFSQMRRLSPQRWLAREPSCLGGLEAPCGRPRPSAGDRAWGSDAAVSTCVDTVIYTGLLIPCQAP